MPGCSLKGLLLQFFQLQRLRIKFVRFLGSGHSAVIQHNWNFIPSYPCDLSRIISGSAVLWTRIRIRRIRMFLGFLGPDPDSVSVSKWKQLVLLVNSLFGLRVNEIPNKTCILDSHLPFSGCVLKEDTNPKDA
jgi:hypothetical protein